MRSAFLFPSAADRRLLGEGRFRGPTPWVIAIMSFSILVVAATGLTLANAAGALTRAIEARYALEVPNGARDVPALLASLKAAHGVTSVEAVSEAEMRQTLKRWLGPAAQSEELPVPALINFDLAPGTDVHALEARLQTIAPGVQLSAHRERVAPILHSMFALQWLALGLVLLLSIAAAAAVVLAARGALDTHRFAIEVMHGIGATDLQLTHLFQRKIAIDALAGSLGGAAVGGLVLLLVSSGASFAGDLFGREALHPADFVILGLLPFALTALATFVARLAVLATLRENL